MYKTTKRTYNPSRGRGKRNPKRNKKKNPNYNTRSTKLFKIVQGDDQVYVDDQSRVISYVPRLLAPKSVQLRLTYPDPQIARTRGAAGVTNWSLQGSAFDPDPALGSGSIPGYNEWKAFYNHYRIVGLGVRGSVSHVETSPVKFTIVPYSGTLITNNSINTATAIYDLDGNPMSRNYVMSQSSGGPNVLKFNHHWSYSEIVGDDIYLLDDLYTAPNNGNPTRMCFLLFAAAVMTGANFATGILQNLEFDLDVEFFDRIILNS